MDQAQGEAFDAFVRSRHSALLRYGHVLTGNPHAAADLVQDALERTGLAWSRVQRQDDPEGYVRRVMTNRHISMWRRLRRERLVADAPEAAYDEPAPRAEDAIWAALAQLPRRQRAVLVLRYYEDLSEAQIARVLDCAPGTVKSQASKGLATLRAHLADREASWTS
ncbi:MAG: polymerase, sigma-24 subunit, subfamily [Frankiales bacterium]|jgi:RNA polymerase sigma-70 factor (sigma-E family)|nr:polymerase, sigma-24 subunit, subfamily [Frankiales bacterium]